MGIIYLHVGGLIAMGFDLSGHYLLTVSHSGRGVFNARTWERVARDAEVVYPEDGCVNGLGPIADQQIQVDEIDYDTGQLSIRSPSGGHELRYEDGVVTVTGVAG